MQHKHLKGLNTLRFFAAALVVMDHGRHHLSEMNINFAENIKIFHRGILAVDFFFVLSGFLISYLAFSEIKSTGKLDYKFFYIRRALRIMPLYYLVLFVSLFLIGVLVPILLNENKLGFPLLKGSALFTFMLPNLVKPIWDSTVGGLNILWSIGVEEQFYLVFPLIILLLRKASNKIFMAVVLFITYICFYWAVQTNLFNFNIILVKFLGTLKFHYMLIGILFSLFCHKYLSNKEQNIKLQNIIDNSYLQATIFILVLVNLFFDFNILPVFRDFISGILFSLLIVIVSHRKKGKIFNSNIKLLSYFGVISYGIYLLHPLVSYFLRFFIVKINFLRNIIEAFPIMYVIILFSLTIILAKLSYVFFETKFLNLKNRFR